MKPNQILQMLKLRYVPAALLLVILPFGLSAQGYRVTVLSPPEGFSSLSPRGINDSGVIVGSTFDHQPEDMPEYLHRGFIWKQGTIALLPQLDGYRSADAWQVNENGQIVGRAFLINELNDGSRTVIWEGENVTDAAPSHDEGRNAFECAINNHGNFGGALQAGNERPPFVVIEGNLQSITTSTGKTSGLNDHNEAVGTFWSQQDATWRAFVWNPLDGFRKVDDLADKSGLATAHGINDKGVIIGRRWASGLDQAYIYSAGAVTDLGTFGGPRSTPFDLNEKGQVVGEAETPETIGTIRPTHLRRAFLYHFDHGMRNLHDLVGPDSGWILERAVAINNHGQIVAIGVKEGSRSGLLLDPLPSLRISAADGQSVHLELSNLVPRQTYRVQRTLSLAPKSWEDVATLEPTTPSTIWTDTIQLSQSRAFYRVQMP